MSIARPLRNCKRLGALWAICAAAVIVLTGCGAKPRATLDADASGMVYAVAFSPDGKTLASGGAGGKVQLWDAETGELRRTVDGHKFWVQMAAFSPDGRTLATATPSDVKLWDARTGELKRTLGEQDSGNSWQKITFTPDGKRIAIVGLWRISFWDVETGENTRNLDDRAGFAVYSPDGKTLACLPRNFWNQISLLDAETGELKQKIVKEGVAEVSFRAVAFSPDGKTLVSMGGEAGVKEEVLKVWDVETGKSKLTLHTNAQGPGDLNSISFSPDGKHVAAAGIDKDIYVWDVQTGELKQTLKDTDAVNAVAFSPDGRTLASGNTYRQVKLWDVSGLK